MLRIKVLNHDILLKAGNATKHAAISHYVKTEPILIGEYIEDFNNDSKSVLRISYDYDNSINIKAKTTNSILKCIGGNVPILTGKYVEENDVKSYPVLSIKTFGNYVFKSSTSTMNIHTSSNDIRMDIVDADFSMFTFDQIYELIDKFYPPGQRHDKVLEILGGPKLNIVQAIIGTIYYRFKTTPDAHLYINADISRIIADFQTISPDIHLVATIAKLIAYAYMTRDGKLYKDLNGQIYTHNVTEEF